MQATLDTPEARSSRAATATAYTDLTPTEAKALATEAFPELLLQPAWQPPEPPPGTEILHYQGTSSALIAPEGTETIDPTDPPEGGAPELPEAAQLLQSTMPLRARTESGELRPLDPTLESHPDHVEPTNAIVEARVPDDLSDGIELPEADITVKPLGAAAATDAELIGPDKLFYAHVAADTDFLVTPTALGVETFLQLRSTDSPERHSLRLDLPPGAELRQIEGDPGATITEGGEELARVQPPAAFDADGTAVPVELTVSGDRIDLAVDFRSGDWRMPIMVDPQIDYAWRSNNPIQGPGGSCPAAQPNTSTFWSWQTNSAPKMSANCAADVGIVNYAQGASFYLPSSYAQWAWTAPPGTYVSTATFTDSNFYRASADGACNVEGIYASSLFGGPNAWQSAAPVNCTPYFSRPTQQYAIPTAPGTAHPRNAVVMQLLIPCSGYAYCYRSGVMWNSTAGLSMALNDDSDPQITSGDNASATWRDIATDDYTAAATDPGLGVKYFWITTASGTTLATRPCDGVISTTNSCISPRDWQSSINYALPEGKDTVTLTAFDQNVRYSQKSWTQLIDRSPPVVDQPSGSFYTQREGIDGNEPYELNLRATDGIAAGGADSARRSGVSKLEVFVDDETEPAFSDEDACNGAPTTPCGWDMERTWQIDAGEFNSGTYTIHIKATDALGHTSSDDSRDFQITVQTDETGDASAPLNIRDTCLDPTFDDGDVDLALIATDVSAIDQIALNLFHERFSGSYVDEGCPEHYVVLIQDGIPAELAELRQAYLLDARTTISPIELVSNTFTQRDLDYTADEYASSMDAQQVDSYDIYTDLPSGWVHVNTDAPLPTATQDDIIAGVSTSGNSIVAPVMFGTGLIEDTLKSRNDYPPYQGGLTGITVNNFGIDKNLCTLGFVFKDGGHFRGSTAGHCLGQRVDAGNWHRVGGVVEDSNSVNNGAKVSTDTELINIRDRHATARLFGSPDFSRKVSSIMRNSEIKRGIGFCFYGTTSSDNNCGRMRFTLRRQKRNNRVLKDLPCVEVVARSGDSGGPVFHVRDDKSVLAAGTVQGARTNFSIPDPPGSGDTRNGPIMCFSNIHNTLNYYNDGRGFDLSLYTVAGH